LRVPLQISGTAVRWDWPAAELGSHRAQW